MDSCWLNEPCSLIGSPPAVLPLRLWPPAGRSDRPRSAPPPLSSVPGEVGGPDDAGLRAELGEPDARHLSVRPRGDPLLQRARGRLTPQLPRRGDPTAEDEHPRVQD